MTATRRLRREDLHADVFFTPEAADVRTQPRRRDGAEPKKGG